MARRVVIRVGSWQAFAGAMAVALCLALSSCGGGKGRGPVDSGYLGRAESLARYLGTDPTVQSDYLARIAAMWLENGDTDRALAVAEGMPNWRKSEMRAGIAGEMARRGQEDEALRQLDIARQEAGIHGEWRRERILAACVEPLLLLRKDDDAKWTREAIQENRSRRAAWMGTVRALAARGDLEGAELAVAEMAGGFAVESAPLRAEAMLLLARSAKDKGDREGAMAHLETAGKWASEAKAWTEGTVLAALARCSLELNDRDGASRMADRYAALAEGLSSVADWKAVWLVEAAELQRKLGNEERCGDLARKAVEAVNGLPEYDRIFARIGLGAGLHRIGLVEQALGEWRLASEAAQAHPHYRTRVMAAIELLLIAARAGGDVASALAPNAELLSTNLPEPAAPWMQEKEPGHIGIMSVPPAKNAQGK